MLKPVRTPEREPVLASDHARSVETREHVVTVFPEMRPMLRAVARDVNAARRRVWVETYIYRHDRMGHAFANNLARAVERGVDVRLLYDPLGCNETDPTFFERLAARGINVRAYRPARVWTRIARWWPRDHARNVVIDDASYTGGAAWGDEWLPRECGGDGWHDVCSRVEGPAVRDFARAFEQRWAEAEGEKPHPRSFTTGLKYPDLEFVTDTPGDRHCVLERYRERIRRARERVWLAIAYFHPPAGMLRDLLDAAGRGVDVRVILPCETDLPIVQRAARAEYGEWIERGLQVYEYCPSVLHAKYALVDDDWGTVGTFNANVTSLRYANEANLFLHDRRVVRQLEQIFLADLRRCRKVTHELLETRPLLERTVDLLANAALAVFETGRGGTV